MGRTLMRRSIGARLRRGAGPSPGRRQVRRPAAVGSSAAAGRGLAIGESSRRSRSRRAGRRPRSATWSRELLARLVGHLARALRGERAGLLAGSRCELGGLRGELADGRRRRVGELVDGLAELVEDRSRGRGRAGVARAARAGRAGIAGVGARVGRRPRWSSRTSRRARVGWGGGLSGVRRSVGLVGSVIGVCSSAWWPHRRTNRRTGMCRRSRVTAATPDRRRPTTARSSPPSSKADRIGPRRTTFHRQRSARRAMYAGAGPTTSTRRPTLGGPRPQPLGHRRRPRARRRRGSASATVSLTSRPNGGDPNRRRRSSSAS